MSATVKYEKLSCFVTITAKLMEKSVPNNSINITLHYNTMTT